MMMSKMTKYKFMKLVLFDVPTEFSKYMFPGTFRIDLFVDSKAC